MDTRDLFFQQYKDAVTQVMKISLSEFDFLQKEHDDVFSRLKTNLPDEFSSTIEQARFLSDDKIKAYRKKILDMGNDSIRKVENEMNRVTVEFIFKNRQK